MHDETTESTYLIGQILQVAIDRPLGSEHPDHPGHVYELNYGYIPGTKSGDGEELDAYVIGPQEPVLLFKGRCIAVIRRSSENDDKLIIVENDRELTDEEIRKATHFQEKYFASKILRHNPLDQSDNPPSNLDLLKDVVRINDNWFKGGKVASNESIATAEHVLGVSFPEDFKWMLKTIGLWNRSGSGSLSSSVDLTLAVRREHYLPKRFLILDDQADNRLSILDLESESHEAQIAFEVGTVVIPATLQAFILYSRSVDYLMREFEALQGSLHPPVHED